MTASGIPARAITGMATAGALAVLIVGGALIAAESSPNRSDPTAILMLGVNLSLILPMIGVEVARRPYSLNLLHLFGVALLVCVSGLYQVLSGYFPIAGPVAALSDSIVPAAIVVSIWIVFYAIGYALRHSMVDKRDGAMVRSLQRRITLPSLYFAMILGVVALAYLASLGLLGAFTRAAAADRLQFDSSSVLFLINNTFVRAIPLIATAAAILMLRARQGLQRLSILPIFLVLVVGVVLTNNPFAAARYWFVAVVMGFFAPWIRNRARTALLFLVLAMFGLTVLPSLGAARRAETLSEVGSYITTTSPVVYLMESGDVDSFGTMSMAVKWTEMRGPRWGMQTLGALLFWVPRSLWPDKPVGTGSMVAKDSGYVFTNYSVPIMTEPFVDFGWLGVPFYALAFGWLLAAVDRGYWSPTPSSTSYEPRGVRRMDVIYPFWLGLVLFMTRGDLLSSFAYTVGVSAGMVTFYITPPGYLRTRVAEQYAPAAGGLEEVR